MTSEYIKDYIKDNIKDNSSISDSELEEINNINITNKFITEDYTSENNTSESSNDNLLDEDEKQITEYEKKYKLKFIINKKKLYQEHQEYLENKENENLDKNREVLLDVEIEVIKNNFDGVLKNLSNKKINNLCNNKCLQKHNYDNFIDNLKNYKTFKTNDKCYKNSLYFALKNNFRGIKTIYNLLLRLIVIYPKYRNKCKCCIIINDKELFNTFERDFKNNKITNNTNILYINFLINKFLNIISLLQCECKFDKFQIFYTLNYCNYKDYFEIYFKTIPIIIVLLKKHHNINTNHEEITLIKAEKCIHDDIRYYNNFTYCKYNKHDKNNDEDFIINYIIQNLEIINEWQKINFKICNLLFNEQSLNTIKFLIEQKKINLVNIEYVFNRLYKNNNIIDINYISFENNLLKIIFQNYFSSQEEIIKNFIKLIITKILDNNNNSYINYDLNNLLLIYINQCFIFKKYEYGLEFINNIDNLKDNKNYHDKIHNIINEIVNNENINTNIKISYFKMIYKKRINIINYDIINKLIEVNDGDKIISVFNKSDNFFINYHSLSNIESIINIINKCILHKKKFILDYLLYNLDEYIKNFNKNNNIINPFQIYFLSLERNEIPYLEILDIIKNYKYNINQYFNKDITYLNLCIKKNYIETAKKLLQYNIITNNIIDDKSIIFDCIDNKNHLIANLILQKEPNIINKLYNNKNIITYLFEKDFEENIKIKFLLIFLKNNLLNINSQDKNNNHIGFIILKSKFKKNNKIILFKLITSVIDPLVQNERIPLIIFSMLHDEFEITYLLMNRLIETKKILKTNNEGIFSYYMNNNINENINYIPIILKFIRDYDRKKVIDNDIEFDINNDNLKNENMFLIIIKFTCFFIIINNQNVNIFLTKNTKIIIENNINKNNINKNNINKNIINKNNNYTYKNNYNQEDNNYLEVSIDYDNNNIILETDTINNTNIWKTTSNNTDSESSEIEVSKICF
jgi:hypothetical protein